MPAAAEPPEDLKSYVRPEDCIECGLCISACPVVSTDDRFVGPAALVAAARLIDEPRGSDPEDLRAWVGRPEGVWQCTTCLACAGACPASIEHVPLIIGMRRLATLLREAGVSFGLLYEGERNAGNDVRAVGEQGLFEMLVEQNMSALGEAQFEAVFTTDPHSLNALRNDYPRYGLDKPVLHYTELIARLASDGVIDLQPALRGARATYHDPCYLARYNHIIESPRTLIKLTGADLVEMPRHGESTFCCGAGGGRIWMSESVVQERPSEQRTREARAVGGLDYFVVSCPKDLVMYSAAAEAVGRVDFEVIELAVLIERAVRST